MRISWLSISVGLLVLACGSQPVDECPTTAAWSVDEYAANTAAEYAWRASADTILSKMKAIENGAPPSSEMEFKVLMNVGAPALSTLGGRAFQNELDLILTQFARASGKTWAPSNSLMEPGGKYGGLIFSERGFNYRERFEKSLFGAHYSLAAQKLSDAFEVNVVDQMTALFGSHPSFPKNPDAAENADIFSAEYAAKRNNPGDGNDGLYVRAVSSLRTARALATGGPQCAAQGQAELKSFLRDWERILAGTTVYYLHTVIPTLEKASLTEAEKSSSLKALSEGVGCLLALKTVPSQTRFMSDEALSEILSLMGGGDDLRPFVLEAAQNVEKLAQARAKLALAEGFTEAEVTAFKTNF
jgi:hypothetical protein